MYVDEASFEQHIIVMRAENCTFIYCSQIHLYMMCNFLFRLIRMLFTNILNEINNIGIEQIVAKCSSNLPPYHGLFNHFPSLC